MSKKLKGGNGPGFYIVLVIIVLFISLISLVIYIATRKTCGDKVDDDYKIDCNSQRHTLNINTKCDGDCNKEQCCDPKKCQPPENLPGGYKTTDNKLSNIFDAVTDFDDDGTFIGTPPNIICDTDNKYSASGTITYQNCLESDEWKPKSGCIDQLPKCFDGKSTISDNLQSHTRAKKSDCKDVDIPFTMIDDNEQKQLCDAHYKKSSKPTIGNFCILETDLYDNCNTGTKECRLPE